MTKSGADTGAAPDGREFSLVTFLAGNRLGHPAAAPLVVVSVNPSEEQIGKMT